MENGWSLAKIHMSQLQVSSPAGIPLPVTNASVLKLILWYFWVILQCQGHHRPLHLQVWIQSHTKLNSLIVMCCRCCTEWSLSQLLELKVWFLPTYWKQEAAHWCLIILPPQVIDSLHSFTIFLSFSILESDLTYHSTSWITWNTIFNFDVINAILIVTGLKLLKSLEWHSHG